MSAFELNQFHSLETFQSQTQKLTRRQIVAMKMLSMNNGELRNEIIKNVKENPALEIVNISPTRNDKKSAISESFLQDYKVSSVSSQQNELSNVHQSMLESVSDFRESLQEHLMFQLNTMHISNTEYEICKILIYNLNSEGFHIKEPLELVNSFDFFCSESLLAKCINYIQEMEPTGICCRNIEESLLIQAIQKGTNNPLVKFILSGNLAIINPPVPEKVKRKILAKMESIHNVEISKKDVTEENIENAIKFIRTLEPRPARNFSSNSISQFQNQYTNPDVYVTKESGYVEKSDFENGIIKVDEKNYFRVTMNSDFIPKIQISKEFMAKVKNSEKLASDNKYLKQTLKSAQSFIETVDFRNSIFLKACSNLVNIQKEFFQNGKGNLVPLSQKKFAEMIDVHESTVSRMADGKSIMCDWGTFRIKYFFTTAFSLKTDTEIKEVSSDTICHLIIEILENQKDKSKHLSDQKIADELGNRGYKIARRTVAKYRAKLNIGSSFER